MSYQQNQERNSTTSPTVFYDKAPNTRA